MDSEIFRQNLTRYCNRHSPGWVSRELGIDYRVLWRWLQVGIKRPTKDTLLAVEKLARNLGVAQWQDLWRIETDEPPNEDDKLHKKLDDLLAKDRQSVMEVLNLLAAFYPHRGVPFIDQRTPFIVGRPPHWKWDVLRRLLSLDCTEVDFERIVSRLERIGMQRQWGPLIAKLDELLEPAKSDRSSTLESKLLEPSKTDRPPSIPASRRTCDTSG